MFSSIEECKPWNLGLLKPQSSRRPSIKSNTILYHAWTLSKLRKMNKNRLSKCHLCYVWHSAGGLIRVRGKGLTEKQKVGPLSCVQYPGGPHACIGVEQVFCRKPGPMWRDRAEYTQLFSNWPIKKSHTFPESERNTDRKRLFRGRWYLLWGV